MTRYRRAIVILIDGARPDVMQDLIYGGGMPNLARHIIAPFGFHTAVSCFPSTTGPAYLPFLMGCFPGTAGVPGMRWMDKSAVNGRPSKAACSYMGYEALQFNHHLAPEKKTLFELFARAQNIYNMVTRGLDRQGDLTRHVKLWLYTYAHFTARWRPADRAARQHLLAGVAENPEFVFAVFPGVDAFTHLSHPRAAEVRHAYHVVDEALGALFELLRQRDWLRDSLVFVISDHGLSQTHTHFDTVAFLDRHGFKAMHYPLLFRTHPQAAVMVSGNAMAHVYVKHRHDWRSFLFAEHLEKQHERLLQDWFGDPAIDLILMRSTRGVVALSRRGRALMQWENGRICYRSLQGDPFGYKNFPPVCSPAQVLALTASSDYPDGPLQALQIFRTARSGDFILSAAPGYDLRLAYEWPEHKSSHGSLHREHLLVPFLANHPLPDRLFRTADLFPTILELMGKEYEVPVDGTSLAAQPLQMTLLPPKGKTQADAASL